MTKKVSLLNLTKNVLEMYWNKFINGVSVVSYNIIKNYGDV